MTSDQFPPCTREKAISSILAFYTLLTQLPYIPADKLVLPPAGGWPTNIKENSEDIGKKGVLDEYGLRNCGKTDSVIDILRHLPYLQQSFYGECWTLMYKTRHINYAIGQTYATFLESDEILPLPGHIIWLTEGFEHSGVYLLLDTHTWEIIEYTSEGRSIFGSMEEYEALPSNERYTAYVKMPADYYLELWKWRHITLDSILVWAPGFDDGTAQWFGKDPRLLWEETMLPQEDNEDEDEEWMPDAEGSENEDEEEYEDEDEIMEGIERDSEEEISLRELEELDRADLALPMQQQDQQTPQDDVGAVPNGSMLFTVANAGNVDLYSKSPYFEHGEDVKRLIALYHAHGWPVVEHEYRVAGRFEFPSSSFTPTRWPPKDYALDLSRFDRAGCFEAVAEWYAAHQRARDKSGQ